MRRTIVRFGATGAGVLIALGLFAGPPAGAAESDKQDKAEQSNKVTCFVPEGKTQGRSMSDPDGDANGGADKPSPDCTGGVDANDRDGNNGCGNDADREDDNNGHCGRDNAQGPGDSAEEPEDGTGTTPVNTDEVAGDVQTQAAGSEPNVGSPAAEASSTVPTADTTTVSAADATAPAAETATATPDTQVLGETLSRPDTAPGTLARTGAGIGGLALLGGLLIGGGRLTVLARKLLRIG